MSDQVKPNQPSDAAEPKSKGDRSNSNLESIKEPDSQKTWNRTQESHKLEDHESATHIALTPDSVAQMRMQGLAQKFEIVDYAQAHQVTDRGDSMSSYEAGLKAITDVAISSEDRETAQGAFSINYMERKAQEALDAIRGAQPLVSDLGKDHSLIAQLPFEHGEATDATNATVKSSISRSDEKPVKENIYLADATTSSDRPKINLDDPRKFAEESAKHFADMLKDTTDPKHKKALEYVSGVMKQVESTEGTATQKAAAETKVFSYICGQIALQSWEQGKWSLGELDHVTVGPVEFRLKNETIKIDTTETSFQQNMKANLMTEWLDGTDKFTSGRVPNMVTQEINSIEADSSLSPEGKAHKTSEFIFLLKSNLGTGINQTESADHSKIELSRPGKPKLSVDLSNTAYSGYVFPDGTSVSTDSATGSEISKNSQTGEVTTRTKGSSGEIVYTFSSDRTPEVNYTLGVNPDGSAWIQEIGTPRVEIPRERADQDWRVQRVRLEQEASERIPSLRDRYQFYADMRELERRYPPNYMTINADDAHLEIAKTFTQLSRLLAGTDGATPDKLPRRKPDEVPWRVMVAEQIMHHAADPTSCDQGPEPVCCYESMQDRQYTRTPSVVAELITDIVLENKFQPKGGGHSISLLGDSLTPDSDSESYKIRKGGAGARSYAGQLYDTVAVNMAFDCRKQDLAKHGFGNVHYEYRRDQLTGKRDYYIVQNGPSGRPLQLFKEAFKDGKTPAFDAVIDVNEAIMGKREVGFFLEGSALASHPSATSSEGKRKEFDDIGYLGTGINNIHSKQQLVEELIRLKAEGSWPPIVSMNSRVDPVLAQYIRSTGGPPPPLKPGQKPGGHTEVIPQISDDGNFSSMDNHWGKRADDTGKPHIKTDQIATAMFAAGKDLPVGFEAGFNTFKKFVDQDPKVWKLMKESWVKELPEWVKTHSQDIKNGNPADWMKKHPQDGFVEEYIKKSAKEDPQLIKWIADAAELLRKYPE